LGKILVIGAAGLIGQEIVKALGESECIRASRSSDERVDISDPKSITALFDRIWDD
jgi:dTDP-4-dehydrorhamnose reductase